MYFPLIDLLHNQSIDLLIETSLLILTPVYTRRSIRFFYVNKREIVFLNKSVVAFFYVLNV